VTSGIEALNPRDDDEEAFIEVLGYSGEEYRLACQCLLRGEVAIDIIG
jgi:ferredoxin